MRHIIIFLSVLIPGLLRAQENIKLYADSVPDAALTGYFPEKPSGLSVLICPGGGYTHLALSHEGHEVASKLKDWGITAFVLKYRLPGNTSLPDGSIGPLGDVQQALMQIRKNAGRWKIDPRRTGIMGFSAGGHLASTAATHFTDSINRPDFQILIYPVVSFSDSITHMGSRENLLGQRPSSKKILEFSAENNTTKNTPPCLLVHCTPDDVVSYRNSMVYFEALIKNQVPVDLHIFSKGGHGFGTRQTGYAVDEWLDIVHRWLLDFK